MVVSCEGGLRVCVQVLVVICGRKVEGYQFLLQTNYTSVKQTYILSISFKCYSLVQKLGRSISY